MRKKLSFLFVALMATMMTFAATQVATKTAVLAGDSLVSAFYPDKSTSYGDYVTAPGIKDNQGYEWFGRWCYQKSGNDPMQMLQFKKAESSYATRLNIPVYPGYIQSITLDVTSASGTSKDDAAHPCTAAVYFSTEFPTSAMLTPDTFKVTANGNQVVLDFTKWTGNFNTGYIFFGAGARVWGVTVVYNESGAAVTHVESVTINKQEATIVEGKSLLLSAEVAPANANNKNFAWSSSNAAVATVSDLGLVTAVAPGNAMIIAKAEDGDKADTCNVTVITKPVADWTKPFTIVFNDTQTNSDESSSITALADVVYSGDEYIDSLRNVENVYNAKANHGIKFGSSSKAGKMTIVLAQAVKPTKIVATARPYSSTEHQNFKLNDSTFVLPESTDPAEYTVPYDGNTEVKEITIEQLTASKGRFYLVSIQVFVENTPAAYNVTWNANGYVEPVAPTSNLELWEMFKPAYNEYYKLTRANQPITSVSSFASSYMIDFMTKDDSPWKWLGDYILPIATAQGYTVNTESAWRWTVHAFFNCSEKDALTVKVAGFTEAGKYENWIGAWQAANLLPKTMKATDPMPVISRPHYNFLGWYNGDTKVESVTADMTLTAKWEAVQYAVTWVTNGADPIVAPTSNLELWEMFKPAYNEYYKLTRANQPITSVSSFASSYMIDFMTKDDSPWKWLGDYILPIATAQGYTVNTESAWRWTVHAFFNCSEKDALTVKVAGFTEAGKYENWIGAWQAANQLPATMTIESAMPKVTKAENNFMGWFDNEACSGTPVTQVTKAGTYYAKWEPKYVAVASIALDKDTVLLDIPSATTADIVATILPEKATVNTPVWTSSDEKVATVANGVITAVGAGQALIIASAEDFADTCVVIVTESKPAGSKLNPFAYGLKTEIGEEEIVFHYTLNNNADSAKLVIMNGENVMKEIALEGNNLWYGERYVTVPASEFKLDYNYTWKVVVYGTTPVEPVKNDPIYAFYSPYGIAVDNNTESANFGRILITESQHNIPETGYHSSAYGSGVYAFNPDFTPADTLCYKPVPTRDRAKAFDGTNISYAPLRLAITPDSRIFATTSDTSMAVVYELSQDLKTWTPVIAGQFDDNYSIYNADSSFYAQLNAGLDIQGSGDDLKLLLYSHNKKAYGYAASAFRLDEYALGSAAKFEGTPTHISRFDGTFGLVAAHTMVVYDKKGGYWFGGNRGGNAGQPNLVHFNANGDTLYYSESADFYGGAAVYVLNDSMIIKGGNSGFFKVYKVATDANGKDDLQAVWQVTTGIGRNINAYAQDFAGNLYLCSNSGEKFISVAMPYSGVVATPAPASQNIFIESKLGNHRPMAYALNMTQEDDNITFSFKSSMDAKGAIVFTDEDGNVEGEIALTAISKGDNTKKIAVNNIPGDGGKVLNWAVRIEAEPIAEVSAFTPQTEKYHLYSHRALVANANPESDGFGAIYANNYTEGVTMGLNTEAGLYQYDPEYHLYNEFGKAFNTGLPKRPYRMTLGEDGQLYVAGDDEDNAGVYVLDGTNITTDSFKKVISNRITGLYVAGQDSNRVLYGIEAGTFNVLKYAIGNNVPFEGAADTIATGQQIHFGTPANNLWSDGRGGLWAFENRSNDGEYDLHILSHINANGVVDFTSVNDNLGWADSRRGSFALNRDFTLMACGFNSCVDIFSIAWDETTGKPALTKVHTIPSAGSNIDGVTFDYAGNVIFASASSEWMTGVALPTDNNVTVVPAKKSLTVTKEYIYDNQFNIEKVWEVELPAATTPTADCRIGAGYNGKFYVTNKNTQKIMVFAQDGTQSEIAYNDTVHAMGTGIAFDEAGNIAVQTGFPNAIKGFTIMKNDGSNQTYIELDSLHQLPAGNGRSDMFSAFGDMFSAEGGYVFFYGTDVTKAQYVKVANGALVETALVSDVAINKGSSTAKINYFNPETNEFFALARGSQHQYFDGQKIQNLVLANNNTSDVAGAFMAIKNTEGETQRVYAYHVNTAHTMEISLMNLNSNKKLVDADKNYVFSAIDNKTFSSSANDLGMSVQKINDYAYYLYQITPGKAAAMYKIYANVPVQAIELDKAEAAIKLGEQLQLTATITPDEATVKDVIWATSDSAVAVVEDGLVIPVAPGSANITATTVDGNLTATCAVTVSAVKFHKMTDIKELEAGKMMLIVDANEAVTMGVRASNGNNFKTTDVTPVNGVIDMAPADATVITLVAAENGAWSLRVNEGYLVAGTSASNYLKVADELNELTSWNINLNAGYAEIVNANANSKRNTILYNGGSAVFSAYAGGSQQQVYIYIEGEPTDDSAVEEINVKNVDVRKVIMNGGVYIIRDGKMYNMQGALVR